MKIKKIIIQNVKSFKERTELEFNKDFNILIGSNGSGKSNLLDILTITMRKYFLLGYKIDEGNDNNGFFQNISQSNLFSNIQKELEKFYNDTSNIEIEFEFIITQEDIENISQIKTNIENIESYLSEYRNGTGFNGQIAQIKSWNIEVLSVGMELSYKILNYNLQMDPQTQNNSQIFLQYLNYFELILILSKDIESIKLYPNYLFFGPYRGVNLQNLQANLSSQNYYQQLQALFSSTSKTVTSYISLATIYFAQKRRSFENEAHAQGFQSEWDNDEEVKLVTKYLGKLGYGWNLELIDKNKNIYEILLTKDSKNFFINQASSGEKEIINFMLGVFAFNLNNGIVIIDEPELHLHPRWQNILLDLFIELSIVTKNQFIISTHSPTFINDKSFNHIIRVHKDEQNISRLVILKDQEPFKLKDILHIINSTNNEKIFFADVVVLVEGITDRIVFKKIIDMLIEVNEISIIVEVIDVNGKTNLEKYRGFLSHLNIHNYLIADLDYLNEIGDAGIKGLFVVNKSKVTKKALKDPSSMDGAQLVNELDDSIRSGNVEELQIFWEYLKSIRTKLKPDLTEEEIEQLNTFIDSKEKEKIFILKLGDIEDYFPEEYRAKKLENVIALMEDESLREWKEDTKASFSQLEVIAKSILNIEE